MCKKSCQFKKNHRCCCCFFTECLSLRGDNIRRPVATLDRATLPYGLALTPSNLYWTDWTK